MKNDECTIYILKGKKCINKFRKGKDGWSLTISTGRVFPCTCEQMISHLLPALAFGGKKGIAVKVIPDKELFDSYRGRRAHEFSPTFICFIEVEPIFLLQVFAKSGLA